MLHKFTLPSGSCGVFFKEKLLICFLICHLSLQINAISKPTSTLFATVSIKKRQRRYWALLKQTHYNHQGGDQDARTNENVILDSNIHCGTVALPVPDGYLQVPLCIHMGRE